MRPVAAVFVRSNPGGDRTPNDIRWASEYKTADGALVYSVDYHQATAEVRATRFADSSATFGLIAGSKLLIEVTEIAGVHFATHVEVDDDADYPRCEDCSVLSGTSILTAPAYLEALPKHLENAAQGRFHLLARYEVSERELRYSSDRPLLTIRCNTCRGEFALRTPGEREPAGIHCERIRHSFAKL